MSAQKANVLFIANGLSRKSDKIQKRISALNEIDYEFQITGYAGEAEEIAARNAQKFTHIVGVGGDGTLNEIVNGLLNTRHEGILPVIGIIPAGSANDFHKSLDGPESLQELVQMIIAGHHFPCDVGKLEFDSPDAKYTHRYFINIADAGIGFHVVDEVNKQSRSIPSSIKFFRAIIRTFRRYRNISVTCKADEWEWSGRVKMLVVANGSYFGSGLGIAPHAALNSGKLAITIGADISTFDYIKYLPLLKKRAHIDHDQVFYKQATTFRITSSEFCGVEADGELMDKAPVTITVLPGKINILGSPKIFE